MYKNKFMIFLCLLLHYTQSNPEPYSSDNHRDMWLFLPLDACGALEVYSATKESVPVEIEDTKSCFETINAILKCVISFEQEHLQYR